MMKRAGKASFFSILECNICLLPGNPGAQGPTGRCHRLREGLPVPVLWIQDSREELPPQNRWQGRIGLTLKQECRKLPLPPEGR